MSAAIVNGEKAGNTLILTLSADHLDAGNSAVFRTEAFPLMEAATKVILDLTGVAFVDSAGLGALLSLMRNLGERGGDFRVCSVAKPVQVLFDLVRLNKILDIHATRDDALASLK